MKIFETLCLAAILAAPAAAVQDGDGAPCWFHHAIFGREFVELDGNALVDSYVGVYNPLNPGDDADCRSNHRVRLTGNATLRGDALATEAVVREGIRTTLTGVATIGVPPLDYPDMADVVASMAAANDNSTIPSGLSGTKFKLQNKDAVTIPGGAYYFTEFTMSGDATLKLTGPAIFFLAGPMKIQGNARLNLNGDPEDLLIVSAADGVQDVLVAGLGAKAWALFYAMKTRVHIGVNGEVFGAVICKEARLNGNAKLHVPETLDDCDVTQEPDPVHGPPSGGGGAGGGGGFSGP